VNPRFRDRTEAGRALAAALDRYAGRPDVMVLALPRGGVPVGYEIARALDAPLDVFLVRKLGVPGHEELGFGALATGGWRVLNDAVVGGLGIDRTTIERVTAREASELDRRDRAYRGDRPPPTLAGREVIVVDDGLATGSTMRVAVEAIRAQQPARIVIAAPVAARDTCDSLREIADEVVCLATPEPFDAIGLWYDAFPPLTDEEVREQMARLRPVASAGQVDDRRQAAVPRSNGR
jgi:putative phosphoribosyl transferase